MKLLILIIAITTMTLTLGCNQNNQKKGDASAHKNEQKKHDHEEHKHDERTNDSHTHGEHKHGEHKHDGHEQEDKRTIEKSKSQNNKTSAIIDGYIQIKNGLAADNKIDAQKGANALLKAFSNFDMTQLGKDQHKTYMEILENAQEQAEHIAKSPIDHQREHFYNLSIDIDDLIKLLGTNKTLYQDFCPMANDGKGATWISEIKEIKNPYFGHKMPKCGEIKKQIN